jgi:hypothetical protein
MKRCLLVALTLGAFGFAFQSAMAQNKTQSFVLTPAEQARLKSDRAAAMAKWAKMMPEEKAATRKAAYSKKRSELSAVEEMSIHDGVKASNIKLEASATVAPKPRPKPGKPADEESDPGPPAGTPGKR